MTSIVTLTVNPALDKSTQVKYVVPEHKLRCETPSWQPGGGGINVARVVKRLGGQPLTIFPAGGPQGDMFRDLLDEEGLEQRAIPITGLTRESFAVREKSTNQQYRFSVPGPSLSTAEWQACLTTLKELDPLPAYLVLSGGLPPNVPDDFYGQVIAWAGEQKIRVILDAHDEPLRQAVAEGVYLIKPNLRELRQLTEEDLDSEQAQMNALRNLIKNKRAKFIVLSLGAAGAVFASVDGNERLRAPTVKIRSKVGAGDSMVGGLVWALAEGYSPREAAQFSVAAGAAAVKTTGTELCRREDVFQLFEQIQEADSN